MRGRKENRAHAVRRCIRTLVMNWALGMVNWELGFDDEETRSAMHATGRQPYGYSLGLPGNQICLGRVITQVITHKIPYWVITLTNYPLL